MDFTAEMIAGLLSGEILGDKNRTVCSVSSIEGGHEGALSYCVSQQYEQFIYTTKCSIVLVGKDFTPKADVSATLIKVENVGEAVMKLLQLYNAQKPQKTGISPKASVSKDATLGEGCYIGDFAVIEAGAKIGAGAKIYPQCYVGDGSSVGENTILYAGVKVYEGCHIGRRCIIHSGAVIGADGFGFLPRPDGTYEKIPQLGNVIIEDDVEIGANTCVDRAKTDSTIIRKGVKLDNLVQIAHNVQLGENTVSSAQTGIAGTTKIGRNCILAGQVGIADHVNIGDFVKIGSKTGIDKDVKPGEVRFGYPALPGIQYHRSFAIFRKLPELDKKIFEMEKTLEALKDK